MAFGWFERWREKRARRKQLSSETTAFLAENYPRLQRFFIEYPETIQDGFADEKTLAEHMEIFARIRLSGLFFDFPLLDTVGIFAKRELILMMLFRLKLHDAKLLERMAHIYRQRSIELHFEERAEQLGRA